MRTAKALGDRVLETAGAGGASLSEWVELCHRRGLAGRKFPKIRPHRAISTDFRLKFFPVEQSLLHKVWCQFSDTREDPEQRKACCDVRRVCSKRPTAIAVLSLYPTLHCLYTTPRASGISYPWVFDGVVVTIVVAELNRLPHTTHHSRVSMFLFLVLLISSN